MDVVHGRQTTNGRPDSPTTSAGVGAKGAPSHIDLQPICVQDLQHVCLHFAVFGARLILGSTKSKYSPWLPVAKARQ